MPDLIKLYIRSVAIGCGVAVAFVGLLLAFDVQNLWTLIRQSSSGPLALFLLWFMNAIVFAGVQFGWAVMALAEDDKPAGGLPNGIRDLVAIPVRVDDKRDRRHR